MTRISIAERTRGKGVPALDRFVDKFEVNYETGCWDWIGSKVPEGYGTFSFGRKAPHRAHRAAWELVVDPIPDGLTINHLCYNRACVNPDHLEPVTQGENNRHAWRNGPGCETRNQRGRTHCKNGHPLSGPNLYILPKTNYRGCKVCRRAAQVRYEERKRQERDQ